MFNWLRRRRGVTQAKADKQPESAACPHTVLMPRWDALEDMGKAERANGYKCDVCGQDLSLEEGRAAFEQGARLFGT